MRRVASDSDTLVAPEQAETASVDAHDEAKLMSFFQEIVAEKPGHIFFKDLLNMAPVPLGAQTLRQVYAGWAVSLRRLQKKRKIAVTRENRDKMDTWKVDVLG